MIFKFINMGRNYKNYNKILNKRFNSTQNTDQNNRNDNKWNIIKYCVSNVSCIFAVCVIIQGWPMSVKNSTIELPKIFEKDNNIIEQVKQDK